jgi:hypothetical protein
MHTSSLNKLVQNLQTSVDSYRYYTVNNGWQFSRPQPGCYLSNSPWPGIIKLLKLFMAREILVNDIPAGDGKTAYLFYSLLLS